jgi:hypothetical protein
MSFLLAPLAALAIVCFLTFFACAIIATRQNRVDPSLYQVSVYSAVGYIASVLLFFFVLIVLSTS